jgi:CubicO group peptidase (beta-lactamase class C family)
MPIPGWVAFLCAASLTVNRVDSSRMEQLVQSYVSDKKFMGAVLIAIDREILLSKGYGFANLEWDIANAPDTKFRLGSVTKQFTSACILMLEERGKLKTSDQIKKYLPDVPASWDKITIFNLLTHTSGIPDFTEFPDYQSLQALKATPKDLLKRFRDRPLDFEPGKKFKYSNSGYVTLGVLIETISGESYAQFVEDNILKPLAMKDSGYDSNAAIIKHRASGYLPDKAALENAPFIDMTVPYSAGGLYSTVEDMLRWEEGLFGGKLLSQASVKKMTTPFMGNYALGLGVHDENGHKVIGHGGGIDGFSTAMAYYPDDKLSVVVLGNENSSAPNSIATKLAAIAHGEPVILPSERKEIEVSEAILKSYAGTYQLGEKRSLIVTVEDGHLMEQAPGQPKLPLFAESQTKFFFKVAEIDLEFSKNDQGEVSHVIFHQGGTNIKGVRR